MDDRTIIVTLADGQQVMVGPADVNLDHFQYWRWADAIIRYGASAPANTQSARRGPVSTIGHALGIIRPRLDLVRLFVERYERKQGVDVVRLQVEDGMAIVTRDGMRMAAEPRLLRDLELPAGDGAKP
jgi:hypothetical protein